MIFCVHSLSGEMVTIGDAISLVEFVQDLAEKLQARADKIDGWSSSTLFKNLELKVNACEKAVAALPEKDAGGPRENLCTTGCLFFCFSSAFNTNFQILCLKGYYKKYYPWIQAHKVLSRR